MPLYEYECQKCHARRERIEKLSGPHLKKCPTCGGKVERLASSPAIQFKGSGWYVTDYGGKSTGDSSKSEKPDSKEGKESKEAKDSKSESFPKDSKPSKKS